MAKQKYPLDRSAAFTALLDLDPEGFGRADTDDGGKIIGAFLDDWYASSDTNMYDFAKTWLAGRQQAAGQARRGIELTDEELASAQRLAVAAGGSLTVVEVESQHDPGSPEAGSPAPEAVEDGVPEDLDKPWQVTTQVCRSVDGWQSSRQVPAFTIPRALAYSKGDAEAKAREIINPYREPYDIHMDVTTDYVTRDRQPEGGRQVLEGDEQQLRPVREGQAEADAEAWGTRGPSAFYAEWVAEGQEDPGPGERQLEDWNEHNYQADSLEPERGE